jgi:RHS repeat-associated protein
MGQLIQTQALATLTDGECNEGLVGVPDQCHIVVDYVYDDNGRVIKQYVPYAIQKPSSPAYVPIENRVHSDEDNDSAYVSTTYDWLGRTWKVTSPDGSEVETLYEDLSQKVYDAKRNLTTNTYDVWGNLITVDPADDPGLTNPGVAYVYDVMGRLKSATYGNNNTTINYDLGGRKTDMTDPDMGNWLYGYDALGNLTYQHDGKHQVTCLYYDSLNRLKGKNYQGDSTCPSDPGYNNYAVAYKYDEVTNGIGRRTSMSDSSGSTGWTYDNRGRITYQSKIIAGNTYMTSWAYNSADIPITIGYPGTESVTTLYLPQMAVNSVTGTNNYVSASQYDENSRLIQRGYGFGSNAVTDYDYFDWDYSDTSNNPMGGKLNHIVSGDNYHTYQDNSYIYDKNGNITSIADLVAGTPQTQVFTYDAINRLLTTTVTGGYNGNYSEASTYDSAGKLLTNKNGTLVYSTSQPHAATALGSNKSYIYDDNGSMIEKHISYNQYYVFTYDAENRLIKIELVDNNVPSTTIVGEYTYDGDGNRVMAEVDETTITRYLGNYYEASTTGSTTTVTKYYYAGSQRVAWRVGDSNLYYGFGDHLGSTSVSVDASDGSIAGTELYEAWGGERYTSGSLYTTFKYTGQREAEAGLYFYNARWYDPEIGRFIQADTIIPSPGNPQAWDRYAYSSNDPINNNDPSGHDSNNPGDDTRPAGGGVGIAGILNVDLAGFISINQYDYEIINNYGSTACGIVAGSYAGASIQKIGDAAYRNGYGPGIGIQPTNLENAYREVYSTNDTVRVLAGNDMGSVLTSMFNELNAGGIVIVDILIAISNTYGDHPLTILDNEGTYTSVVSHFARVLQIDFSNQTVTLDNTLGQNKDPWVVSFNDLAVSWYDPENRTNPEQTNAEKVDFWAISIKKRSKNLR